MVSVGVGADDEIGMSNQPQRGKTTAASNAGSFAHKQHGEPGADAALDGSAHDSGHGASQGPHREEELAAAEALKAWDDRVVEPLRGVQHDLELGVWKSAIETRTSSGAESGRPPVKMRALPGRGLLPRRIGLDDRQGTRMVFDVVEHGAIGSDDNPTAPSSGLALRIEVSKSVPFDTDAGEREIIELWSAPDGTNHARVVGPDGTYSPLPRLAVNPVIEELSGGSQSLRGYQSRPSVPSLLSRLEHGGGRPWDERLSQPDVQAVLKPTSEDDFWEGR